jgi:signal recognition particle receptor subunit beta
LAGATLLVFANKQDISGALTEQEIKQVFKDANIARLVLFNIL